MDFKQELIFKAQQADKFIAERFFVNENRQKLLYESMNYSLSAGGKRLRPVLMMSVCEMLGTDFNKTADFACAIEMIHTYSLIHDDLPAMDNDKFRRGKLTNHIVYGEDMAILAGDALLNKAFEVALSNTAGITADKLVKSLAVLAQMSGSEGMIGGQVVDIQNSGSDIDEKTLEYMYMLKTCALIRASGLVGAIIAGATDDEYKAIDKYCINLGMAFQIQDDILDIEGDEKILGKPIGSDQKNNKKTFVSLLGLEKSKELVKTYSYNAIDILQNLKRNSEFLEKLTIYLIDRNI